MEQLKLSMFITHRSNVLDACAACFGDDTHTLVCLDRRGRWHAVCNNDGSATNFAHKSYADIAFNMLIGMPEIWPADIVFAAVIDAAARQFSRSKSLHER